MLNSLTIILTVLKYSMPVSLKDFEISTVVITAATGWPFPMGLPGIIKALFINVLT